MKQKVAYLLALLLWLGLPVARPLRAQTPQARIFYQPGNRVGWLPVPAAVVQAYRRHCPEMAADTTLYWHAYRDEPARPDTSMLRFRISGQHRHLDARLVRRISYYPSAAFKASGEALTYTHETTLDALPWLARRAARRAGRDIARRRSEQPSLYLLVAFTEPQAARKAHRTAYQAYFVTSDDSLRLYPAGSSQFWQNGRFIKQEPHMKFR